MAHTPLPVLAAACAAVGMTLAARDARQPAVKAFPAASTSVKAPGPRDFATKTTPVVKTHLDHVKKHAE